MKAVGLGNTRVPFPFFILHVWDLLLPIPFLSFSFNRFGIRDAHDHKMHSQSQSQYTIADPITQCTEFTVLHSGVLFKFCGSLGTSKFVGCSL